MSKIAQPGTPAATKAAPACGCRDSASAGVDFSRSGGLLAGPSISEQYLYLTPSYTFETSVLRGQLSLGVTFSGNHNAMAYVMGSVPTGSYDPNRLAGVGVGPWAVDWGLGHTYFAPSGFEFSVTAGLTYNFVNPQTGYQSGMDGHIDFGTSCSFGESFHAGAVAYIPRHPGETREPRAVKVVA